MRLCILPGRPPGARHLLTHKDAAGRSQVWDFPHLQSARCVWCVPHARANMIHSIALSALWTPAESKSELEFARALAPAAPPRKILAHNETLNTDLNFMIII